MSETVAPVEVTEANSAALDDIADRVERYTKAKALEKAAKDIIEETRADIAAHLEARGAEFGTVEGALRIRWRPVTSKRLDQKKLGQNHPEIVEEHMRESTSMRMEIVT